METLIYIIVLRQRHSPGENNPGGMEHGETAVFAGYFTAKTGQTKSLRVFEFLETFFTKRNY